MTNLSNQLIQALQDVTTLEAEINLAKKQIEIWQAFIDLKSNNLAFSRLNLAKLRNQLEAMETEQ